jgi:hypothetical protein
MPASQFVAGGADIFDAKLAKNDFEVWMVM